MTPRKKVTDVTKAKLPLPKGHPQRKAVKRPKPENRVTSKRCPRCRKLILLDPKDGDAMGVHTCYDAKALREEMAKPSPSISPVAAPSPRVRPIPPLPDNPDGSDPYLDGPLPAGVLAAFRIAEDRHLHPEPSPIAGQPLPEGLGSQPAPEFLIESFSFDVKPYTASDVVAARKQFETVTTSTAGYREPLYDTRPIPWSWETPTLSIRRKVAGWLTTLAKRIAP